MWWKVHKILNLTLLRRRMKRSLSFWAFPEWKAFAEAFGMMLISFNWKPINVGRNLVALK